ncbi:MAG: thiaminase II [Candidatus Methylomirabilales bacterium]
MGYSEELRRQAEPIWNAILEHPFLRELMAGSLPLEKFRCYLIQDWHYLNAFARAVGAAISKAPDSRMLEHLADRVLTPIEKPLHRKLAGLLDLDPAQLSSTQPSPTNTAYTNHLLATAAHGGVGEIAAALLPCPWTYQEIGRRLGDVRHPVYSEWAAFYASGILAESVQAWRGFVDEAAATASGGARAAIADAFLRSSRYEYLFWEMAYRQEEWSI